MDRTFEEMSNAELIAALGEINPLALNLSDLLVEMWKRGLREAKKYAADLSAGSAGMYVSNLPDTRIDDVVECLLNFFDGPPSAELWSHLLHGYEARILEAILISGTRNDPQLPFEILKQSEKDDDATQTDWALRGIVLVVPLENAALPACLIEWADWPSLTPNTRLAIFERLAELPWSQALEDFFVQQCIDNKYDDPRIAAAISRALDRPH